MSDEQPDYDHYFAGKAWTPPPAPPETGLDRSIAATAKQISDLELALEIAADPDKHSIALDAVRHPQKYAQPPEPTYEDFAQFFPRRNQETTQ